MGAGEEIEGVTGVGVIGAEVTTTELGTALGLAPVIIEPSARLTSLRGATFPLKNSEALREGSIDGAGGKISDWNESACKRKKDQQNLLFDNE